MQAEQDKLDLYEEGVISHICYALDNTTKTRAVFEINKGSNIFKNISVNASIDHKDRRVPFENMMYIADGPSDIPVFSVLNQFGGRTYAVYEKGNMAQFEQVKTLLAERRVQAFGEADYRKDTQTYLWLISTAREIAERMVEARKKAMDDRVGNPPAHLD